MKLIEHLKSVFTPKEANDLNSYFNNLIPKACILLMVEQLILTAFDNQENFITTLIVLCFFVSIEILRVRGTLKWLTFSNSSYYIYGIGLLGLAAWWFYTDGLFGSMGYYFPFVLFTAVAIFDRKYHPYTIGVGILVYLTLSIISILYPSTIHPYSSKIVQQIDIISACIFSLLCVVVSFSFIKKGYNDKQQELTEKIEYQERLNEELDNFVYKTSHDLRAPVTSCLGLIDVANNCESVEEMKQYMQLQQKSLEKMNQFINDILYYSRNQRQDISIEAISFEELYYEIIDQLKFIKGIDRMDFSFHQSTKYVCYSDALRLQMVFKNIIVNAINYQDKAKPNPKLALNVAFDEEKKKWVLEFKDNGQGIPKSILPNIFNMFYRGNKLSQGSGVGLFIVKQALDKLKGGIECHSTEGVETIFTVYLPDNVSIPVNSHNRYPPKVEKTDNNISQDESVTI